MASQSTPLSPESIVGAKLHANLVRIDPTQNLLRGSDGPLMSIHIHFEPTEVIAFEVDFWPEITKSLTAVHVCPKLRPCLEQKPGGPKISIQPLSVRLYLMNDPAAQQHAANEIWKGVTSSEKRALALSQVGQWLSHKEGELECYTDPETVNKRREEEITEWTERFRQKALDPEYRLDLRIPESEAPELLRIVSDPEQLTQWCQRKAAKQFDDDLQERRTELEGYIQFVRRIRDRLQKKKEEVSLTLSSENCSLIVSL
jgi:hypothetical protein